MDICTVVFNMAIYVFFIYIYIHVGLIFQCILSRFFTQGVLGLQIVPQSVMPICCGNIDPQAMLEHDATYI